MTTTPSDELFELCKSVYEQTGWFDTPNLYIRGVDIYPNSFSELRTFKRGDYTPLYSSDYLLDKLPGSIEVDDPGKTAYLEMRKNSATKEFQFSYESYYYEPWASYLICNADSPLKALLKLVQALHDKGELK
ncbi:hypothetical protein AB4Y95_00380 [Arthrobacter sp. M-10]|uniref:hypothetical protein n=1 Tax=Arthrobacter sp. M-10 TaxID=3233037 RepID=UPI003F909A3B